jgi:hypothetical protein
MLRRNAPATPPGIPRRSNLASGEDYISLDTGMTCKDVCGIRDLGELRGPVHYRNDKGGVHAHRLRVDLRLAAQQVHVPAKAASNLIGG